MLTFVARSLFVTGTLLALSSMLGCGNKDDSSADDGGDTSEDPATDGNGAGKASFLLAPPNCVISGESPVLQLDGAAGGNPTNVLLTGGAAGGFFAQVSGGEFAAGGVYLTWEKLLSHGEGDDITFGTVEFPSDHILAGTTYCIKTGKVGFTSEGTLKFEITALTDAIDAETNACGGNALSADLNGCWASSN